MDEIKTEMSRAVMAAHVANVIQGAISEFGGGISHIEAFSEDPNIGLPSLNISIDFSYKLLVKNFKPASESPVEENPHEKASTELCGFLDGKDTHRIFIPPHVRFEIRWALCDENRELENKIADTGPCTIAVITD
jgi:hypothetical protein